MPGGVEWPGILADIAEVAGPYAALRVAEAKGGRPAYFPRPGRLTDDHWLVVACGWDAARAIARRCGGTREDVPLGPLAGNRAAVRRAIREGIAAGASRREVAARAGVALRTVQRHANAADAGHDDQHQLF
jgi:hypothetical protein